MTDEKKHTDVMTALAEIKTELNLIVKPAVSQTYDNKDDIIKIKSFLSIVKWVGTSISAIFMFITIRSIWTWIKPH